MFSLQISTIMVADVTKNNADKFDEFLPTLTKIFRLARIFGISNIGCNVAFLWTLAILLMLLSLEATAWWKFIKVLDGWASNTAEARGFTARVSGSMFYGNALLSLILSLKLMASWKGISTHWLRVENKEGLRFAPDRKIKYRAILLTSIVAFFAVVEHGLSMMSATGLDCPPSEYLYKYILSSHGFLMKKSEYRLWFAIPIFILSKVATALWNFQDLIIILISMGLTSRYHRLNLYVGRVVRMERKISKEMKTDADLLVQSLMWRRIRESYVRQAGLVRIVDKELGPLVLLSNINNLYFICLQLFLGLNSTDRGPLIKKLYYFISLGWLIFRACSVVLAASDVHVHSKRALIYLHSCPDVGFNTEVKRLRHQLNYDYVALSGLGLFSLNRQLLLQVAAAILKYELVLIQYDK